MLLITTPEYDLHARAVAWAFQQLTLDSIIFSTVFFPSGECLSASPLNEPDQFISQQRLGEIQKQLQLSNVKALWARRPFIPNDTFDFRGVHSEDLNNVVRNTVAFNEGVLYALDQRIHPSVARINPFDKARACESKVLQLHVAKHHGFKVPETYLGNHPESIQAFCELHGGKIVVKPFQPTGWENMEGLKHLPTALVTTKDLLNDTAIRLCPMIYQRLVHKQYELRVVVMGEKIIAAKLNSQNHHHSSMDWRLDAYHEKMQIEPYLLDNETCKKILAFMRGLGLRTGSIDLIRDLEGDLVFLEINQQGQFLFLERQCPEIQILAEFCSFLSREMQIFKSFTWPSYRDYMRSPDYAKVMKDEKTYEESRMQTKRIHYSWFLSNNKA